METYHIDRSLKVLKYLYLVLVNVCGFNELLQIKNRIKHTIRIFTQIVLFFSPKYNMIKSLIINHL